jgi:hypothetical protein
VKFLAIDYLGPLIIHDLSQILVQFSMIEKIIKTSVEDLIRSADKGGSPIEHAISEVLSVAKSANISRRSEFLTSQAGSAEPAWGQQFFSIFRLAAARSGISRSNELSRGERIALNRELKNLAFHPSDNYRGKLHSAWLRHDDSMGSCEKQRAESLAESLGPQYHSPSKDLLAEIEQNALCAMDLLKTLDQPCGVEIVFENLTKTKPDLPLLEEDQSKLNDVLSGKTRLNRNEIRDALGTALKRFLDEQNSIRQNECERYMTFAEQEAFAVEIRAYKEAEQALAVTDGT